MRKKLFIVAALILMYIIFLEGCVYHKGNDYPHPPTVVVGGCNDTNVRYSVEIKSILDANCISCHNGTASVSGIDLYDYEIISKLALDNKFTYGTLLSAVLHKGGAPFMPQSNPQLQLQDCDINKIAAWVYHGAPDN